MFETIRIQNYALINEVELEFRPGLTVLTGETGAGKSIIVDALNLVLGSRASAEVVREGARKAQVDALFRMEKVPRRLARLLKEHDIELEDGCLLLSRSVSADGRSRAYAGGNLVPAGVLAAIGDEMVDLHGQHEHQSLLNPERQMDLLDGFGGTEEDAVAVAQIVSELRDLDKSIADLEADDRERERRLEFLRFEVGEIDAAALQPGEEEETKGRRNLIANAETIVNLTSTAYGSLYEQDEGAAIDRMNTALKALMELSEIDGQFQPFVLQLERLRSEVEDLARQVRVFTDQVEYDPNELDNCSARLALISGLRRKYGETIEVILEYRAKAGEEIDRYEQRDQRLAEMNARRITLREQAHIAAQTLSRKRKNVAAKLDRYVTESLQELGMKGGLFKTRFENAELGSIGIDRVEFLLTANPGEKAKPLRQVASGGEISRVMLALKTVFANADKIPTLIFDEIDSGVGGAMASQVALRLRDLASSHQTLCITHLAQIAASAQTHYVVSKTEEDGRTLTHVLRVEGEARIEEVARLLDGSLSGVSLEHARALLKGAMEGAAKE